MISLPSLHVASYFYSPRSLNSIAMSLTKVSPIPSSN